MALAAARDERAPELALSALGDAGASPLVRAAGAWALAQDVARAPSGALAAARSVAAAPGEDAHLRAEALHLLAEAPDAQDRALAASTLSEHGAPAEIALAAARLALRAGEERGVVARALAAHEDARGLCARAARTLEEAP